MEKVLVIGAGYSGERIARLHAERGDAVLASRRSVPGTAHDDVAREAAGNFEAIEWLALDLDLPGKHELPRVDRVYYTAPPSKEGLQDQRLRNLLQQLPGSPLFVYFSTTGVYGDAGGNWLDETAPLQPANNRSRRRVDAEIAVADWAEARDARCVILRVAGIYGPGRLPISRLRERRPVIDPAAAGFSNRIHVDDLARAAIAAADHASISGQDLVLNIADGKPTSTAEFLDAAAEMTGLPKPERIDWATAEREFSEMALSFLRDNKRIDTTRLEDLPNFALHYPDFHDGLRASLEAEANAS